MKKESILSQHAPGSSTSNLISSKVEIQSYVLIREEKFNESSINLLKNSGIDFDRLESQGIDHQKFAEYFMTSGLVMNRDITWYGFHTDHEFAYLLRMISGL